MNFYSFINVHYKKPMRLIITSAYFVIVSLALLSSCGKKQKTLFNFSPPETACINKLALPTVRMVSAQRHKNSVHVSWKPIDKKQHTTIETHKLQCVGYHVYRLTHGKFIHKKPITSQPTQETLFVDHAFKKITTQTCYAIRIAFLHNNSIVLGPLSRIASITYTQK